MAAAHAECLIHPSAVVYPGAELAPGVEIGPYCVVENGVELGEGCRLLAHVHLLGRVIVGPRTVIGSGSVVGGEPADKDYHGERTLVRIGADCRLHEHVTVHRASGEGQETVLDEGVRMMAGSHVGHNSHIGARAQLVNGSLVAGHAEVGAGAILVGNSAVHQFTRVGRLTLVGGASMVTKDAPPFSIVAGSYPVRWRAPNTVGLRRADFPAPERDALRRSLHRLFALGESPRRVAEGLVDSPFPSVAELATFILSSRRGVCAGPEHR